MAYINVGVRVNGEPVKTKAALKRALKDSPGDVTFYGTSPLQDIGEFGVEAIPIVDKLQVVGPDPFTSRKWYATVVRGPKVTA